jgi:chemotaxis protein methyltransferase CheR
MTRSEPREAGLLGQRDFIRLAQFVHARSGIRISPSKKTFLESRIRRHLRVLGFATMKEYCRWLFDEGGLVQDETALLDAVTTNKTEFFRERHHFEFLSNVILPDFRASSGGSHLPLRIWSAGCSNGAEPYSLAIICEDFARTNSSFSFEILASDISTEVLQVAMRAIYPHSTIGPVSMELRKHYLLHDPGSDEVRIIPDLRRKVLFKHHNLMDEPYPVSQKMDIVFCRNLLIYFDRATQRTVLSHLCRCLRPGGYLFLGHSEGSIADLKLPLRAVGPTIFIREEAN